MSNLSDKTILVIDHGLYPHVAVKLAETFKTVMYWVDWTHSGFPSEKRRQIGSGLPNVQKVDSLWRSAREADLIVACDVYFHDEIAQLRQMKKPVWGAGYAEALEIERLETRELMQSMDMDVIPYEVVIGGDALRAYLADKGDCWIKASVTRGDFETLHWQGEHLSTPDLEKRLHNLGPRERTKEFIVEPSIPGCEFGYDPYSIDGRFGNVAMYGAEDKDNGYWAKVCDFEDLPAPIRIPTLQFGQALADLGCRGFYSNEIRIATDGTSYLIDPCLRCGSPPSESYIELFSNWPEVMWAGANGELVDLEPEARYAAQIILKSEWLGEDDYLPVFIPENIRRWVKLHNYCILDGEITVMPQPFPEFGAVIGMGDTREEAKAAALEHIEQVQALDLSWEHNVFDTLEKTLTEGRGVGISFD